MGGGLRGILAWSILIRQIMVFECPLILGLFKNYYCLQVNDDIIYDGLPIG